MDMGNAFPTKYLKASDLQDRQVRAIMDHVQQETVGSGESEELKYVLYFSKSNLKTENNQDIVE